MSISSPKASSSKGQPTDPNGWEIVRSTRMDMIRRIRVEGGYLYQVQSGMRYDSVAGTIGRQHDPGEPTWWQPVFVPARSK